MTTPAELTTTPATESPAAERERYTWVLRGVLVLYLVLLLGRAWWVRQTPYEPLHWHFQSADVVIAWLTQLVGRKVLICTLALGLGLLVPQALPFGSRTGMFRGNALAWLTWVLLGIATTYVSLSLAWRHLPHGATVVLPLLAYMAGLLLSAAALRGARALALTVVVMSGMFGALGIVAFGAAQASISKAPLDFPAHRMSLEEKRQLAERIRDTRPRPGESRVVTISDNDFDALINSVIARGGARNKAHIQFLPGEFLFDASVPVRRGAGRFLNIQSAGQLTLDDGRLHLEFDHLRMGDLWLPRFVRRLLAGALMTMFSEDAQIHRVVQSVALLELDQGKLKAVFWPGAVERQFVPSLVQLLWQRPDVAHEAAIHARHLADAFERTPPDADRFAAMLQAAFRLAQQRSIDHDPVLENRAAIFALAILLGHEELEQAVGEVLDDNLRQRARAMVNQAQLRGRSDFVRHFLVSAALKLTSDEELSDRVGLHKEKQDSQQGGSGFSFADVLANRSGIRFAEMATRDAETARDVQRSLSRQFDVDRIMPPADDLPEGISQAELRREFGGVRGERYQELLREIDRRVDRLHAL